jgi:hypothetical protein
MVFGFKCEVWLGTNFFDYDKVVLSASRDSFKNNVFNLPNNLIKFLDCTVGYHIGSLYFSS